MSRMRERLGTVGLVLAATGFGSCLVGTFIPNGFRWGAGVGAVLVSLGILALVSWVLTEAVVAGVKFVRWAGSGCSALWAYETVPTARSARYDPSPSPETQARPGLSGGGQPAGLPPALVRNQEIRLLVVKHSGCWDEATWSTFLARVRREYGSVEPGALLTACEQERSPYRESQGDGLRALDRLLARASAYGPPKPFRNKFLGWLFKALGWGLFGAGGLAVGLGVWLPLKDHHLRREEALALLVVGLALGLPLLLLGSCCRALGTRLASRDAAAEFYADDRLPVVYLRSFGDDSSVAGAVLRMALSIFPHLITRGRFTSDPDRIGRTAEERLVDEFREKGPVIAIGRPGERLASTGAARAYVGHDEWQAVVIDLITRASLVVVRLGTSDGLSWEIDTVLKGVPWRRILFQLPEGRLFGRKKRAAYRSFRERSAGLIGSALPAECRAVRFIAFDESGNPLQLR